MTTQLLTCHHVLVVHHDGAHECEGSPRCGADELAHEWVLACADLRCRCAS